MWCHRIITSARGGIGSDTLLHRSTAHNQRVLGPPPLVRPRGVACAINNERMSSVEKVKKKKKKTKHSEAPLYVVR